MDTRILIEKESEKELSNQIKAGESNKSGILFEIPFDPVCNKIKTSSDWIGKIPCVVEKK